VNLSTGRVLIIVALIVAGLAVLANGFADEPTTAAVPTESSSPRSSTQSTEPPSTTEPPTATPAPEKSGVLFMALNGTDVPGAGAAAQTRLTGAGYKSVATALDSPVKPVKKTTVYYRPDDSGQNQADATYVASKYFGDAAVKKLDPEVAPQDIVPPSATIVVVVGEDFASHLIG
jgi:hypothetical protein